jgi:hypothetical protein
LFFEIKNYKSMIFTGHSLYHGFVIIGLITLAAEPIFLNLRPRISGTLHR